MAVGILLAALTAAASPCAAGQLEQASAGAQPPGPSSTLPAHWRYLPSEQNPVVAGIGDDPTCCHPVYANANRYGLVLGNPASYPRGVRR
jgi:hypothetical protein